MFNKLRLWYMKKMLHFWSNMATPIHRLAREEPNPYRAVIFRHMVSYVDKKWVGSSKKYTNLLFGNEEWYTPYDEES